MPNRPTVEFERVEQAQPQERVEGRVVRWLDDRGYGFIEYRTPAGIDKLFFHQTGVLPIDDVIYRPKIGCDVSFAFGFDRGRSLAVDVQIHSWPEMTAEEYFMEASDLPVEAPAIQPACLSPENRNKSLRELIAS